MLTDFIHFLHPIFCYRTPAGGRVQTFKPLRCGSFDIGHAPLKLVLAEMPSDLLESLTAVECVIRRGVAAYGMSKK